VVEKYGENLLYLVDTGSFPLMFGFIVVPKQPGEGTEENKISEEHPGAVVVSSGLLMQNIPCRWQGMLLYG
jgi:hypothetical protein